MFELKMPSIKLPSFPSLSSFKNKTPVAANKPAATTDSYLPAFVKNLVSATKITTPQLSAPKISLDSVKTTVGTKLSAAKDAVTSTVSLILAAIKKGLSNAKASTLQFAGDIKGKLPSLPTLPSLSSLIGKPGVQTQTDKKTN